MTFADIMYKSFINNFMMKYKIRSYQLIDVNHILNSTCNKHHLLSDKISLNQCENIYIAIQFFPSLYMYFRLL